MTFLLITMCLPIQIRKAYVSLQHSLTECWKEEIEDNFCLLYDHIAQTTEY